MQLNQLVAILKMEDGVSFALQHFFAGGISMPTLTLHRHNTDTHTAIHTPMELLTGSTTSESSHQAVSAAVKEAVSRFSHRRPGQCLQVSPFTRVAFKKSFHV